MQINWTVDKIRKTWLEFWKSKDHVVFPSQSLIPVNDPSLMWINSGVATLKKYFSGREKPPYQCLTSCQKAIRTNDIENVGLTSRHHTFFEMLGNFSIGNCSKNEIITNAFELLTKIFNLPLNRLYITVFEKDEETYKLWIEKGIKKDHIIKCNKERNFWDVGSGPCGPCTEIYYDRGQDYDWQKKGIKLFIDNIENDRYIEIWNIVFSQYENDGKNNYHELVQKNIDTGAGLERLACILQNVATNFEIDIFQKIIKEIEKFTTFKYDVNFYLATKKQKEINYAFRIIADHVKAACFAIGDGAIPSNKERGYVIRKLIRRAILYGHKLKIEQNFLIAIANSVISTMSGYYSYLITKKQQIITLLIKEEKSFRLTIAKGLIILEQAIKSKKISGEIAFKLMDTYGFPIELTKEIAKKNGLQVDLDDFRFFLKKQQEKSKNKNTIFAMQGQNVGLINFKKESMFIYSVFKQMGKIIGIFDEKFNFVTNLDQKRGMYWLVFDKTCLYATSGGQKSDKGIVKINNKSYELINCIKGPNLQNFHCLNFFDPVVIKIGDTVETIVDVDNRKITSAHHTCIHLLQKSLKLHVDQNIKQEGSLITNTKASFDFNYSQKLNSRQLEVIEKQINDWIKSDFIVLTELMTFDEAVKFGAIGYFEKVYEKIKSKLRVVIIDKITSEICAGTHVKSLREIGQFRIIKLIAKGSGSWRIEFICTPKVINDYLNQKNIEFNKIINELKGKVNTLLLQKISFVDKTFFTEINNFKDAKNWDEFKRNLLLITDSQEKITKITTDFKKRKMVEIINEYLNNFAKNFSITKKKQIILVKNQPIEIIQSLSKSLISKYSHCYFLILNLVNEKIFYALVKSKSLLNMESASDLVEIINKKYSGKGGGKNDYAQGIIPFSNENLEAIKKLFLAK